MKTKELIEIYDKIEENRKNEAKLLINELEFIIESMEQLKAEIRANGSNVTIENYSQKFIKTNPALDQYNKMVNNYHKLLNSLYKLVPEKITITDDGFEDFINNSL